MWSRVVAARSRVFAFFSLALGLLPGQALAQPSKDNTSPPIDVPTTPVPQGPAGAAPPPPGAPPPKAAPKPAAPPPAAPKGDDAKGDKTEEEKKDLKYNNEGVFKMSGSKGPGVVGGSAKKGTGGAAAAPAKGKGGKAAASTAIVAQWPGFRMTEDGGSEVMVEFGKPPNAPTEHKAAGSVTYVFKGAHVLKTNNKNPLITVHFNTPVASVRLVPKKGELHLIIDYRAGSDAAASSGMRAASESGGQQFFVKFPAGSYLPKGADSEEMPPPPTQKLKSKGEGGDKTPPPKKPESGGSKTGPSP